MWPTSPAEPLAPRWIRPSTTIPAPIPVPILTKTKSSTPRPQPAVSSPSAITLTSLSTQTGHAALGESLPQPVAVPARHDRRRDRPARLELDRPGNADADPPERAVATCLGDALLEELLDVREHSVGAGGDVGRLLPVDDDPAGQVRERDVGAGGAEVGDEQVARVGAEAEQTWRPAARRDADAVVREQPVVPERVDALREDGAPEPGRLRQLRPRRLAVGADVVEHRDEIVRLGGGVGLRGHFGSESKDICRDRQDFS